MAGGNGLTLGALLRQWRERALLTQDQLAERTGLSARTIRRLETGDLHRPRSASLRLLGEALRLDVAERAILAAMARSGAGAAPRPARNGAGAAPQPGTAGTSDVTDWCGPLPHVIRAAAGWLRSGWDPERRGDSGWCSGPPR